MRVPSLSAALLGLCCVMVTQTPRGAAAQQQRSGPVAALTSATETENNNSIDFADEASGFGSAIGEIQFTDDPCDFWRITSNGEFWLIDVAGIAPGPIPDPFLRVYDKDGRQLAYNDDRGNSTMPQIGMSLPVGVYFVEVGRFDSTSGGNYVLNLTKAPVPQPNPSLTNGQSNLVNLPTGRPHPLLITDADVDIAVTARTANDLVLVVQDMHGTVVFENDEATVSGDPAVRTQLPLGVYSLTVFDTGGVPSTYDLTSDIQQTTWTDLCSIGQASGNLADYATTDRYLLDLSLAPKRVTLSTTPASNPSAWDTMLELYDRKMRRIAFNDDDVFTTNAEIDVSLPAGVYYVGVRLSPWNNSIGGYTLNANCQQTFTASAIRWGRIPGIFPASGRAQTYRLDVCSPTSASLSMPLNGGDCVAILNAQGELVSGSYDIYSNTETTAHMLPGQHWAITYEPYLLGNGYWLELIPPLHCTHGALQSRAKEGDLVVLLFSASSIPGISVIPSIPGLFCLGAPAYSAGPFAAPAAGFMTLIPNCPTLPAPIYLQQVEVHGSNWSTPQPSFGHVRNLLTVQ